MAGYAMAEVNATDKLKLIGGVRNEYTDMRLYGSMATVSGKPAQTTISPATVTNSYNALLPMLHAKYSVNSKMNIRAAFTRTFVRPNFADMTPGQSVDNTQNPVSIVKGNPDLKPTFSNNYDLMGEYYFDNIGLLSGGVFYKDISNVVFSDKSYYNDGTTNYVLTQSKNLSKASLFGFEAGISKRFNFLKGFWSGFGVEFNYTFINSEASVQRNLNETTKVTDKTSLPNQSRTLFNAILFYERNGVMVRLAGNYRGKSVETINQQLGPDYYIWTAKNFTVDASATVNINKHLKTFVELNNLTDEPLRTYMGDERRLTATEWYGIRGQAGIRWDIIK
jgi:TonB-dependent receptor